MLKEMDSCREYAVITEPLNGLRLVVCGLNGYQRQHHIYSSRSHVVRLQMAAWPKHRPLHMHNAAEHHLQPPARYLIHYQGTLQSLSLSTARRVMRCFCLSLSPSVTRLSVPPGLSLKTGGS